VSKTVLLGEVVRGRPLHEWMSMFARSDFGWMLRHPRPARVEAVLWAPKKIVRSVATSAWVRSADPVGNARIRRMVELTERIGA